VDMLQNLRMVGMHMSIGIQAKLAKIKLESLQPLIKNSGILSLMARTLKSLLRDNTQSVINQISIWMN
jgi:hypothetical protein